MAADAAGRTLRVMTLQGLPATDSADPLGHSRLECPVRDLMRPGVITLGERASLREQRARSELFT